MEDGAEEPANHTEVGEDNVVLAHGIFRRQLLLNVSESREMLVAIEDREDDGEGFLETENAQEGPFTVELFDRLAGGDTFGGDGSLTLVVTIGRAAPCQESEVKRDHQRVRPFAVSRNAVLLRFSVPHGDRYRELKDKMQLTLTQCWNSGRSSPAEACVSVAAHTIASNNAPTRAHIERMAKNNEESTRGMLSQTK